ncbi:hypothetical protein FACS189499_00940 [Clostridia bacterium]|nr:hypothetical protein FACS189499_00940 [Clostridia bacterium]
MKKFLSCLLITAVLLLPSLSGCYYVTEVSTDTARIVSNVEVETESAETSETTETTETSETTEKYRVISYVTVPASENWRWIGTDEQGGEVTSAVNVENITHINFAFGMIEAYQFDPDKPGRPLQNDDGTVSQEAYLDPEDGSFHYKATVKGWIEEMDKEVDGSRYLPALVKLREKKPSLKVLLSVGGWDSDGFCYMAKTDDSRAEFIESLIDLIKEYDLDGIDLDWEYPTNGGWGAIASCPTCVSDAKTLLKETRSAFSETFPEENKLLTIASGAGQAWVDADTLACLDYMNVMCYDYDPADKSRNQSDMNFAKEGMAYNVKLAGANKELYSKFNLGVPFYNWGGPNLVPYYKAWDGKISTSPDILRQKMEWVKQQGYGGAFYWAYSMDIFEGDESATADNAEILQRTVWQVLND